jgi:hypothetical protein
MMGILSNIFSKIFPPSHPAASAPPEVQAGPAPAPGATAAPGASRQSADSAPSQPGGVQQSAMGAGQAGASQQSASVAAPAPAAVQPPAAQPGAAEHEAVDVEAILNDKARQSGQPLNWRTSIVDLLKALDLDSSLAARKQLAQELHFPGDLNDTGVLNQWLHRQVMVRLAANGGQLPPDLRT